MDEIPEGWDKDLYDKLRFDFLIECAENEKIDEWNELYLEYLDSEWTRLYPEREWYSKNVVELVGRVDISDLGLIEYFELQKSGTLFKRPDFAKNFQKAISRGVCFYEAHLEGASFTGAQLQGATFNRAYLEMADFNWAHLEGAAFSGASLEGATFKESYLERAKFSGASLERATFKESHLERATFSRAHLEGAEFIYAIVNGETLFTENTIDKNTDFTGTGLSATRIDPVLRTKLERNIREIRWKEWYKNHRFLQIIMRPFWFLTDFGASTIRPVCAFILWNTIFAIIYFLWLGNDFNELMTQYTSPILTNIGGNIIIFLTDWMKSNLMIISLTDMATTKIEPFTLFFVFLHVFVGYFILAALVARLSIMFQNLSPNDE